MLQRFLAWLRLNWARNWLANGGRMDWRGRSWLAPTLEFNDLRTGAEAVLNERSRSSSLAALVIRQARRIMLRGFKLTGF